MCLMFVSLVVPAYANEADSENVISFSNLGKLYEDLGAMQLVMLMLTPKDQRAMYYHTVSTVSKGECIAPNAWYFEGLVEDDICQSMKQQGFNVVCNTACPEDRQTGLTCGLSHKCCRPAEEAPSAPEKQEKLRCNPYGESRGIQYCTFL